MPVDLPMIPHSRPTLSEAEATAAAETIRSGMIGAGERVGHRLDHVRGHLAVDLAGEGDEFRL